MITRIEIDDFKSFSGFSLSLTPFTAILGQNASGKSNLFDAIRFLSRLAENDVLQAMRDLRGEPEEFFRKSSSGITSDSMRFSVDVLIDRNVTDPWGISVDVKQSRIRYDLELRRIRERGNDRVVVASESAIPISWTNDPWRLNQKRVSRAFKERFFYLNGRSVPFLETNAERRSFDLRQDGHAGRSHPAESAGATILSSVNSASEFPHQFALREEMRSWKFIQLDAQALRLPSSFLSPDVLLPDGSNLAAVIARLSRDAPGRHALSQIVIDLHSIVPQVLDIRIAENSARKEYDLLISMDGDNEFSARIVSDGTLRVLALLALLHDPNHHGVVCYEEPENGVHPARLAKMMSRVRDVTIDPLADAFDKETILSQLIVNSHSLVLLDALEAKGSVQKGEAYYASMKSQIRSGAASRITSMERVTSSSRLALFEGVGALSSAEVYAHLNREAS